MRLLYLSISIDRSRMSIQKITTLKKKNVAFILGIIIDTATKVRPFGGGGGRAVHIISHTNILFIN